MMFDSYAELDYVRERIAPTWPWLREFVNVNRLGLPAIKLFAYDHLCLFGWPVPLPTTDDRSFIY
jgi:hypothetical protein